MSIRDSNAYRRYCLREEDGPPEQGAPAGRDIASTWAALQASYRALSHAALCYEAMRHLCADPDPDARWLHKLDEATHGLTVAAGITAKRATALAVQAATLLPPKEMFAASVAVEAAE